MFINGEEMRFFPFSMLYKTERIKLYFHCESASQAILPLALFSLQLFILDFLNL